jgi:DNA gyrase subunit A
LLTVTAHEVPEVSGRSRGAASAEVFSVQTGERIVALVGAGDEPLLCVTAQGSAKRLAAEELRSLRDGALVLTLLEGDRLVAAFLAGDETEVVLVASDAQALRTTAGLVPVQGRASRGVAGMKLRGGATVLAAGPATEAGVVFTATDADTAKLTPVAEIPTQGRAAGGVRLTKLRGNNGETAVRLAVVALGADLWCAVGSDEDPAKADPQPQPVPVPVTRRDGTSTRTARRVLAAGRARW